MKTCAIPTRRSRSSGTPSSTSRVIRWKPRGNAGRRISCWTHTVASVVGHPARMAVPPFSVGVEEELLLVDRQTHALAHISTRLLETLGATSADIKHDLYEAQIE